MNMQAIYLFCDTESGIHNIHDPWVEHGVTYATDGRICIALDTPDAANTSNDKKRPLASGLFKEPKEWHPLPEQLLPGTSRGGPCWHCLGYKQVPWNAMVCQSQACDFCSGFEPDSLEEFDAPIYSCMLCGIEVARFFIEKLRILLDGEPCEVGAADDKMLVFRWNGGKAALMGLHK